MLALLLADLLPVPDNFEFSPNPRTYIAVFGLGFMVTVVGHIAQSKTLIAAGLLMIVAAMFVAPLVVYLSGGG